MYHYHADRVADAIHRFEAARLLLRHTSVLEHQHVTALVQASQVRQFGRAVGTLRMELLATRLDLAWWETSLAMDGWGTMPEPAQPLVPAAGGPPPQPGDVFAQHITGTGTTSMQLVIRPGTHPTQPTTQLALRVTRTRPVPAGDTRRAAIAAMADELDLPAPLAAAEVAAARRELGYRLPAGHMHMLAADFRAAWEATDPVLPQGYAGVLGQALDRTLYRMRELQRMT